MKIAICNVQEFNPTIGGIERVSVSLARELIRAGMEVFFIACRKSPYSEAYELPARQVFLPGPEDYSERNVESMARIIREEKADILLNQNSHSELYNRTCAEVKRATGVRLVSELHFSPDARIRGNRNRFDFHHLSLRENIEGLLRHACTLWPLRLLAMRDQRRMMCNLYRDSDLTVLLSNEFKAPFMKIAGIKEGGEQAHCHQQHALVRLRGGELSQEKTDTVVRKATFFPKKARPYAARMAGAAA